MFTMVMHALSCASNISALLIIIYIGYQTEVISNTRCSLKVSFEQTLLGMHDISATILVSAELCGERMWCARREAPPLVLCHSVLCLLPQTTCIV